MRKPSKHSRIVVDAAPAADAPRALTAAELRVVVQGANAIARMSGADADALAETLMAMVGAPTTNVGGLWN